MTRFFFVILSILILLSSLAIAQDEEQAPSPRDNFNHKHQVGVRLGVWSNLGDDPPESGENGDFSFATDIGSASFYAEVFFGYRLSSMIVGELSLGVVNRGTVALADSYGQDIGNLQIYPMLVHLKFYPLAAFSPKFTPYVSIGGGLYYGRRSVQFSTASYYYPYFEEESDSKIGYAIGGGFDWPLNNIIALEANARYMPFEFSDGLVGVTDYSAFTVAVGVKYTYSSGKN